MVGYSTEFGQGFAVHMRGGSKFWLNQRTALIVDLKYTMVEPEAPVKYTNIFREWDGVLPYRWNHWAMAVGVTLRR